MNAQRFGNYTLIEKLAAGGMGETHLAEQVGAAGVSRRVVIKKMLPRLKEDETALEAFVQEARISSTLSHGNIAQVYEFGEVDGSYFLAMEHVNGRSLQKVLERAVKSGFGRLPHAVSAYVAIELLKALHYAHTRVDAAGQSLELIHRDVSPDNVMLSFEGEVKLVDFGIAKASMKGRTETEPGLVKGKYRYLSPEQARAETLDPRSDLFSAGIVLYEMVTGDRPFTGAGHAAMEEIVYRDPVPPKVKRPDLPDDLAMIVVRALQKRREDRFASALQMQEALSRWLYRQVPDFSSDVLRELMGELFGDELTAMGKPFVSREHATKALRAVQTAEQTAPAQADAQSQQGVVTLSERPESVISRTVVYLLGGAAAATALVVVVLSSGGPRARPPPDLETCLAAQSTTGGLPHLDTVRLEAADCIGRALNVSEQSRVERWLCAQQQRSVDTARALGAQGDVDGVESNLRFEPLPCTKSQVDTVRAELLARTSPAAPAPDPLPAPPPRAPDPPPKPVAPEPRAPELRDPPPRPNAVPSPSPAPRDAREPWSVPQNLLDYARVEMKEKTPQGYAEASLALRNCIELDKKNADCHKLLAAALGQVGDAAGAAKEYELFLKYAPKDHPDVRKVKLVLDQYYRSARRKK